MASYADERLERISNGPMAGATFAGARWRSRTMASSASGGLGNRAFEPEI